MPRGTPLPQGHVPAAGVCDNRGAGKRFRCSRGQAVCLCGCACVAFLCFALVAAQVHHVRQLQKLEPLLDAFDAAEACQHSGVPTCILELREKDADHFDLHPAESTLFGLLYWQVANRTRSTMREILCGAHVVVAEDAGAAIYGLLTALPGARERISSHTSDRKQFGIPQGRVISTLLVGANGGSTWFQFEANPWDPWHNLVGTLGHCMDFVRYKFSRSSRNRGPLGKSEMTDAQPLIVGSGSPLAKPSETCGRKCSGLHVDGARGAHGRLAALLNRDAGSALLGRAPHPRALLRPRTSRTGGAIQP